jgi:hypothetical protein
VLWVLTINNIVWPLTGIGVDSKGPVAGCFCFNVCRTLAHFINVGFGLFLTILGFWIVVFVFPTTSCADIGLNMMTSEGRNHACTSLHIISWMNVILFGLVLLFAIFQMCMIRFFDSAFHSLLDSEGWRSINPEWAINFQRYSFSNMPAMYMQLNLQLF